MMAAIVLRLREAAAAMQQERVSMQAMAQAQGPEAQGTFASADGHALPAAGAGAGRWHGARIGDGCAGSRHVAGPLRAKLATAGAGRACLCLRRRRAPCQGPAEPSRIRRPTFSDCPRSGSDGRHRRDADPLRQRAAGTGADADADRPGPGVSRWCRGGPGADDGGAGAARHGGPDAGGVGLGRRVDPGLVLDVHGSLR